jgi:hypothetical protein
MREYDVNEPVESREEEILPVEMRGYDRGPELRTTEEYKPKKQDILKEYEIGIRFLSVGCVVSIGCKQIPFRSVKEAMEELNKYVENPYVEAEKWHSIFDGEE